MRLGKLGKRQYAYGLTWLDVGAEKPIVVAREAALADRDRENNGGGKKPPPIIYGVVTNDGGERTVGFARLDAYPEARKGSIYSYAAALAAAGEAGIFVAPIDDDNIWYVGISSGAVIGGTDVVLDRRSGIDIVGQLSIAMDLPIFVAEGFELDLPGAGTFDSVSAVARVKVRALRREGAESPVAIVVASVAVVGVLAGGWYMTRPEPPVIFDNTAQVAEQQRTSYLLAARRALEGVPASADWVTAALAESRAAFPSVHAGWTLRAISCEPGRCSAIYEAEGEQTPLVTHMQERFGVGRVGLPQGTSRSVNVNLAIEATPLLEFTDDQILAPHTWPTPAFDTISMMSMRYPGVQLEGPLSDERLNDRLGAPPEALSLHRSRVSIAQDSYLDPASLKAVAGHFSADGFVPVSLIYSTGSGAAPAAWRIDFTRIGGS